MPVVMADRCWVDHLAGRPPRVRRGAGPEAPPQREAREVYARELDDRADYFDAASNESRAFRVVFCDLLLGGLPLHEAYLCAGDVELRRI